MSKTIVGIFPDNQSAQNAAHEVKKAGLKIDNISIVSKSDDDYSENTQVSTGLYSGTAIGGVAGLALGLGTIMVPGLGVIAAAGPIAGLISGAVSGGVIGTLVDLGIPEEDSRNYEQDIKNGRVYFSMPITDETGGSISKILKDCGAETVSLYNT